MHCVLWFARALRPLCCVRLWLLPMRELATTLQRTVRIGLRPSLVNFVTMIPTSSPCRVKAAKTDM
jgi:hypothetical protein